MIYLRADDFGASPGTNEAIIDAIDCGTVTNVGVLACGPYLTHGLDALIERADRVAVGLHSAVNSEWSRLRWGAVSPPERVPGLLAEDQCFHSGTSLTAEHASVAEIAVEIQAQLDHLRALGLKPVYLDCHMGFHWIAGVRAQIDRLCEAEGLLFVDDKALPKIHLPSTATWPGDTPQAIAEQLQHLEPTGKVWVFHPAYADSVSKRWGDAVAKRRNDEARLLIHPQFKPALAAVGLRPAAFSDWRGKTC